MGGANDGWNNEIKFDYPIKDSGWVFVANGSVYYTDGYQLQKLYGLNQTRYLTSLSSVQDSLLLKMFYIVHQIQT